MKNTITAIIFGKKNKILSDGNLDIVYYDESFSLNDYLKLLKTTYVCFIDDNDEIDENYFKILKEKIKDDFDSCFINSDYIETNNKIIEDEKILKDNCVCSGEYIWRYIYNRVKLIKLLECDTINDFNVKARAIFNKRDAISNVLYHHNINGESKSLGLLYVRKEILHYDNIIFMASFCNIKIGGFLSWLINLGKNYGNKYNLTILYYEMIGETYNRLSQYFNCVRHDNKYLYTCNSLITTMHTFFYPNNIAYYGKSTTTIHCNLGDYDWQINYKNFDIYDKYIAVSKTCMKLAEKFCPKRKLGYIYNPLSIKYYEHSKHLKLVSAQVYDGPNGTKRFDRIERMAKLMDKMGISYTWNVFTNAPSKVNGGLIYRDQIEDVSDYIQDADYLVNFSESESFSYQVVEALSLKTKIIGVPLPIWDELGIEEGKSGYIVNPDYFEVENEDKLIDFIHYIFDNKDKKCIYDISKLNSDGYKDIFYSKESKKKKK